jgi:hypothetical protein
MTGSVSIFEMWIANLTLTCRRELGGAYQLDIARWLSADSPPKSLPGSTQHEHDDDPRTKN